MSIFLRVFFSGPLGLKTVFILELHPIILYQTIKRRDIRDAHFFSTLK